MNFSKVIAGCMSWGKWGKNFSTEQISEMINYCYDLGITTFDHADIYGDYTTETEFGKAFKNSTVNRDDIQLISKCGIQYVGETRSNTIKHYNYDKNYIIWSVETSLKQLQTDYLDTLLLHRPSPLMQTDEIAEAILQLKNSGKIKHFGVSNFTCSQMELIQSKISIDINQIEFSLTHFDAMHDGTLDYILQHNIIPMAWSPLGTIFRETSDQTDRVKKVLDTLSKKYNATHNQLLLAWIHKHPSGIIPVVGTTNKERLSNALKSDKIKLEKEDWFALLVASQGHKVP